LRGGSDAVAFLEAGAGDRNADRGFGIDIGRTDYADGGGETANHLAGGRILYLSGDAEDLKLIAHLDAGVGADVEDDLSTVDCGNEAINGDGADGDLARAGDEVAGETVDRDLGGFADGTPVQMSN
jgi:hypothetical protein